MHQIYLQEIHHLLSLHFILDSNMVEQLCQLYSLVLLYLSYLILRNFSKFEIVPWPLLLHPQYLWHLLRLLNCDSVQNRKFILYNRHWPKYFQASSLDDISEQNASTWVHIKYRKLYFYIVFLPKIYSISKVS